MNLGNKDEKEVINVEEEYFKFILLKFYKSPKTKELITNHFLQSPKCLY